MLGMLDPETSTSGSGTSFTHTSVDGLIRLSTVPKPVRYGSFYAHATVHAASSVGVWLIEDNFSDEDSLAGNSGTGSGIPDKFPNGRAIVSRTSSGYSGSTTGQ